MKTIERAILEFQEKDFFVPIRDKVHYVKILVLAARKLLLEPDENGKGNSSNMKLIVGKMSRLFFYKDNKYFSISFPFTTVTDGNCVTEISTYSGKIIDFKSISSIISILDSTEFKLNPSLIDFFVEPSGIESAGLLLLEEIFLFEPSYLRFDIDPENENGRLHPLNHLDINYSQYSTFKLGLNYTISREYFEGFQDIATDCAFLA